MQPGEKIKKYREAKEIKQVEFAKVLGISQGYLAQIENGIRKPSRAFLEKVIKTFDISSDYILSDLPEGQQEYPIVGEQKASFIPGIQEDRRLLKNANKRKIINEVLKILDSENDKVIRALKSNLEVFLIAIKVEKDIAKSFMKSSECDMKTGE